MSWLEDSFGAAPPTPPVESPVPEESEPPTRIGVELPPVVVVPAHPWPDGGGLSVELGPRVTGEPVAVVFSTVERLLERLGRHQPWIMVPSARLPGLLGGNGVAILLDPSARICTPQWDADRLRSLEEYIHG